MIPVRACSRRMVLPSRTIFHRGSTRQWQSTASTTPPSEEEKAQQKPQQPFQQLPDIAGLEPPKSDRTEPDVLLRLQNNLSVKHQQKNIQRFEALFQAAQHQASDPRWYGPGQVPRTFRSRHAILTMHIWFLHKRLVSDRYDQRNAEYIDEELFNAFWDDTTCRIRQTGAMELVVNKHLMQVQQYSFLHLTHYDHAFTLPPDERLKELRKIIAYHVFRDESLEQRTDHMDRFAWYVDSNFRNIVLEWPDEYYRESLVKWVNLPEFSNIRDTDGSILKPQAIFADDVVPEPWRRNITRRGIDYYWNTKTREAQYEKPIKK